MGTGNVSGIIKEGYKQFGSGAIVDGLAEILDDKRKILLGNFNGSTSKHEIYTITTGAQGGMQRADISLYAHRGFSQETERLAKTVVSAVVTVSSVEPEKVTEASIRVVVQNQFPADKQKEILDISLKANKDTMPKP